MPRRNHFTSVRLKIKEKNTWLEYIEVANTLENMVELYKEIGKIDVAENLVERAINIHLKSN